MAIESLRSELLTLTKDLVKQLNQRQLIVNEIQKEKINHSQESYDPKREFIVFNELKNDLQDRDLKDLYLISLMIETHAGTTYPQWSESIHLNSHNHLLREKINPLLLLLLKPSEFKMLDLKEQFKVTNE